jgi:cytochrome bd ubiquinol oxidase subunit II
MFVDDAYWLPIVFICLIGFALLVYSILDGYDLGIGILLPRDNEQQRDTMIASIGPFWDANETWLVLAVGILLIAFPAAHSMILGEFYLPVTFMLVGLILRGVAFDFRAKANVDHKENWDWAFRIGSLLATLTQGYMLGSYIVAFEKTPGAILFCVLSAVCVAAAYCFIGAAWLLIKTEGELQRRAAYWARRSVWLVTIGILTVSIVNPWVSDRIFDKWFAFPQVILLMPIPVVSFSLLFAVDRYLKRFPYTDDFGCWVPFVAAIIVFFLCFQGLAYSFYPYVVQDKLTIWQAASAPESLNFILYGVVAVLPAIIGYTAFVYSVFWGKATELRYH